MATPTFEIDTPCLQGAALSYAFAKAEYEGEKNALGVPMTVQTKILGVFVDGRLFDVHFVNVGELITKYQMSVCPCNFLRGGKIIEGFHARLYGNEASGYAKHEATGATLNEAVCRVIVSYKSGDKIKIPFHAEISVGDLPAIFPKDSDELGAFSIYYTPCSGYFCANTEQEFVEWFSNQFERPPTEYRVLSQDEALGIVVNVPSVHGGLVGLNLVLLAQKSILEQSGYKQPFRI